jgi:2-dehydro-3-deoxyglucarate aldolase/4-hydroxy-2-oxoheptanedioate aldolase
MRSNAVRARLAERGTPIGTMVTEFATTGVARLAARAGAEFVLFDLEHTGYGIERMRETLAAARSVDVVPFLRVPDADYDLVARALDLGALGVMVPAVESVDEAQSIAEASRYPPVGRRGFGTLMRDDWHPDGVQATMEQANREVMTLVQIETARGLDEVDGIAATDGIDVLWIGHFDLSASLGVPGDFESGAFRGAVDRILSAGERAAKPVGMVCGSVEEGRTLLERGFRILAYSIDIWLYEDAVRAGVAGLRE